MLPDTPPFPRARSCPVGGPPTRVAAGFVPRMVSDIPEAPGTCSPTAMTHGMSRSSLVGRRRGGAGGDTHPTAVWPPWGGGLGPGQGEVLEGWEGRENSH